MQRIAILLEKISAISQKGEKNTAIDIDLMLDYTRVLYADLLEWRSKSVLSETLKSESAKISELTDDMPMHVATEQPIPVQQTTTPIIKSEPIINRTGRDIRNNIGVNDKYLFISELFGNNRDAYESALKIINSMANYEQAVTWLDENTHDEYNWNEEDETVQLFYNTVNNFFSLR